MPLEASYQVDPALLGQAAFEAASVAQARKNREETIPRQQRADEMALSTQLAREGRAQQAAIYADQSRRMGQADEFRYLANQEDNARALEQERIRAEQDAEAEHEQTIRSGLKDGTFYYSQDQTSRMEGLNRSLEQIQSDDRLDDDLRQQMIEAVISERNVIERTPMMRSKPKDPTPQEQFATRSLLVSPSTKQMYEFGDPNAPADAIMATQNRSGQFQFLKDPNAVTPQTLAAKESSDRKEQIAIWKARLTLMKPPPLEPESEEYKRLLKDGPFGGGDLLNRSASTSVNDLVLRGPPGQMQQLDGAAGPVQVGSIQEALALPPGTMFITPDGRTKVRP